MCQQHLHLHQHHLRLRMRCRALVRRLLAVPLQLCAVPQWLRRIRSRNSRTTLWLALPPLHKSTVLVLALVCTSRLWPLIRLECQQHFCWHLNQVKTITIDFSSLMFELRFASAFLVFDFDCLRYLLPFYVYSFIQRIRLLEPSFLRNWTTCIRCIRARAFWRHKSTCVAKPRLFVANSKIWLRRWPKRIGQRLNVNSFNFNNRSSIANIWHKRKLIIVVKIVVKQQWQLWKIGNDFCI